MGEWGGAHTPAPHFFDPPPTAPVGVAVAARPAAVVVGGGAVKEGQYGLAEQVVPADRPRGDRARVGGDLERGGRVGAGMGVCAL